MAKEVEQPKEEKAPAYFMQYSALWCIMLGFFVMLLSLGKQQRGPGAAGVGEIRDAFGAKGGIGLMPFAKNVLFGKRGTGASSFRITKSGEGETEPVDDYVRGMLWNKGLSSVQMVTVNETTGGMKIILILPIKFRPNGHLELDSIKMLELFSELIFSLNNYEFEIISISASSETKHQTEAMLHSATVTRFLLDTSNLSPNRLHAVAYANNRFLDAYGIKNVNEKILISIQKNEQE